MKKTNAKRVTKYAGGRSKVAKTVNVARLNIHMTQETADNFKKVQQTIANLGPDNGDAPKPLPSASLILARLLKVYLSFIPKRAHEGGKAALTEEYTAVTEPDTVGAGAVKF